MALSVLYDDPVDGTDFVGFHGLCGPCRMANYYFKKPAIEPVGPSVLRDELNGIAQAMRMVAGLINHMSPTARRYISMMPDYEIADAACRHQMDLWREFNASEAFPSPFLGDETRPVLAERLEGMAGMLGLIAEEAGRIAIETPGKKSVFSPPPVDLGLFASCARVLVMRGKDLTHLRPIAEAIYSYVTGNSPSDSWGDRHERSARKKFSKYTPPIN